MGLAVIGPPVAAQTITVVGTRHLTGMEEPPRPDQLAHTVDALAAFRPTQVCVERMSGERIEMMAADPARHGATLVPDTHGRPLSTVIIPTGVRMQAMLGRRPADARQEAEELVARWGDLDAAGRARVIALQLAGFEFHSAVLNWSHLEEAEREEAGESLGSGAVDALRTALESVHEVYSLGVPLARRAGLHELCTADSLDDETRGMSAAMAYGGAAILERPDVRVRFDELTERWSEEWRPEDGPAALTSMLRFFNSDEFRELDRRLARGPEERVLFIVGSAHRPFTEADLRAQPWVEVVPAESFLEMD